MGSLSVPDFFVSTAKKTDVPRDKLGKVPRNFLSLG